MIQINSNSLASRIGFSSGLKLSTLKFELDKFSYPNACIRKSFENGYKDAKNILRFIDFKINETSYETKEYKEALELGLITK